MRIKCHILQFFKESFSVPLAWHVEKRKTNEEIFVSLLLAKSCQETSSKHQTEKSSLRYITLLFYFHLFKLFSLFQHTYTGYVHQRTFLCCFYFLHHKPFSFWFSFSFVSWFLFPLKCEFLRDKILQKGTLCFISYIQWHVMSTTWQFFSENYLR